jgi:4-amino-4-deoxy-L-arabinose transferase-like glycosyltransferase
MKELLVFILLAVIVALGAYVGMSEMSLKDTARLSAVSTIILLLAFTALTFVRTWDGVFNQQNGEYFHGTTKIGVLGFSVGCLSTLLVYALINDINLNFVATMLTASALTGFYLSQKAKAHFGKENHNG